MYYAHMKLLMIPIQMRHIDSNFMCTNSCYALGPKKILKFWRIINSIEATEESILGYIFWSFQEWHNH